jgi:hypothetical protein
MQYIPNQCVYYDSLETSMELHDGRVVEARTALTEARKRDPSELTLDELRGEATNFRKYFRWLIDVADDAADTDLDEEVSQVTIWGGVYIAPADTRKLCDECMQLLDLVWETSTQQEGSCPGSASADSAA